MYNVPQCHKLRLWSSYDKESMENHFTHRILNRPRTTEFLPGRTAIQKIWKRHFLGNISNSCYWVTYLGLKTPQKFFFENISTNVAVRGFQTFSIKEGAAVVPSEQWPKFSCQIRGLTWWTYAENFN